jgi:hypothetical protein
VCRTTNRPSLPRTPIRGSPAATLPACKILIWRGSPSLLEEPSSLRIDGLGVAAPFAEVARFDPAHPAARHRAIRVESATAP